MLIVYKRTMARAIAMMLGFLLVAVEVPEASGQPLTIYEIQYTTNPDGTSDYHDQVVDCVGGIVVEKYPGNWPRLILQDPDYPDGWGSIQVKDRIEPFEMFEDAQIGDWIEFTNMLVQDYRGTTFLEREAAYSPGYNIVSQGNPLPPPLLVPVSEIPAPLYDPGEDGWFVEDHEAELYESMRLTVADVTVTEMDLGKAVDNYNLQAASGDDCWATDYMNEDVGPWGYHPLVEVGRHFCTVSGVFEQYTKLESGWDYYQLVTMSTDDLGMCGDLDCDGAVDLNDINPFVLAMTGEAAYQAAFPDCSWFNADCDGDGAVDFGDINPFVELLTEG